MEIIKIVNARNAIESLADLDNIGSTLAYWMTKFISKTKSEQEFYSAEVNKLIGKYAEKNEDGTMSIRAEDCEEFEDAISKLNDTDVEDPGIRFKLSELTSDIKLSMKQMYPLLDFIDEDN